MSDGILRSKPPRPTLAISRPIVIGALIIFSFLIALGLVLGRRHPSEKKQDDNVNTPSNQVVTLLPSSYADVPKPPPPQREVEFVPQYNSELLKMLLQREEERRKRESSARISAVSFQGVSPTSYTNPVEEREADTSSTGENRSSRDNANRQDDKLAFLRSSRDGTTSLSSKIKRPNSQYELLAGTLIPGLLLTGINSDLPGQLLGQVSQHIYDSVSGKFLLIPQGTKIIGTYDSRIVYGQERVLVIWTRLIFPNGNSISLEGMPGVDLSGFAGLSDKVDNHYLRLLTGVIFSSVLGAAAQIAEGPSYYTQDPTYGQLAVQGVARNANQVGQEITRRNLNVQPTLEVRPGFRFNVFVQKDITLENYQ